MNTLTYGLKVPQTGDLGSTFFPALEDNFTQLDAHTHNGTDSARIPTSSLSAATQAIASGSWADQGEGTYRQTISMSGGYQFDNVVITFRDTDTGHYYNLTVEKVGAASYYVYINDDSINLTAYYGL